MLNKNILLTTHRSVINIDIETLKKLKEKVSQFDTVCFETDNSYALNLNPGLTHILDYYLYVEAVLQGKKIIWFNNLEKEMEIGDKFQKEINLSQQELMELIEKTHISELALIKSMYDTELTYSRLKKLVDEHESKYYSPAFKKANDKLVARDKNWKFNDSNVLYIVGYSHALNHPDSIFSEGKK